MRHDRIHYPGTAHREHTRSLSGSTQARRFHNKYAIVYRYLRLAREPSLASQACAPVSRSRYATAAVTAWRLGLANVASVMFYRFRCLIGAVPGQSRLTAAGDMFRAGSSADTPAPPSIAPIMYFGWKETAQPLGGPPDWLLDPFTLRQFSRPAQPWHRLPDFDGGVSDIKCTWELSRWDWVLRFAQHYRHTGEASRLEKLNTWLRDWLAKNPPYFGPNWKCGQEASIRTMHLAMAALILGQVRAPTRLLLEVIRLHLRRIEPTISYAMAQNNNHGTSEAAALFIGGNWLAACGDAQGLRWAERGRYWLENRAARLIEADGSFSQYSVNYHRLVLDTLGMAEVWRRQLGLPGFSGRFQERAKAASQWLYAVTDPSTGDAPNFGANDGARLISLTDTDYRDYRPSVELAMTLFAGLRAYPGDGAWDEPLRWLGIERAGPNAPAPESRQLDDGGYAVLRRDSAIALVRYPRFRFRPGHADALHVDLWKGGVNLLRDGGSYSYADPEWMRYFSGTQSHNTVQFDDRDQMPRLGRFLFGDWLNTESVEALRQSSDETTIGATYRDGQGARHHRRLSLSDTRLIVEDRIENFSQKAVLRWRLMPGDWRIEGKTVTNGAHALSIEASVPIVRLELVAGWESRYYMQKTELPVLEVEVHQAGALTSEYRWAQ